LNLQKNRKTQVILLFELVRADFMEWKKAPTELVDFIADKMKNVNCDYKKMFGYPAYFINGNMFAGVHGEKLFLRLSDTDVAEIFRNCASVTSFEAMPGRAMKGYVVLPKTVYSNNTLFAEWLNKSIKYVSSLPAKGKSQNKS
jgi:TfoX/Sxy family transcriptional regulator of competence genes